MLIKKKTMYKALVEKDSAFDGMFFAGVKSTGIFCRPTCRARKPKMENVDFFSTAREAVLSGYRPCKICRPLEPRGSAPAPIVSLIEDLQMNPAERIRDSDLRRRGLEPSRIRRWFKKNHGMTFQAFQRSLRIGTAYGKILRGDRVTDTAFSQGFESLSGFSSAFKKHYGKSPKNLPPHNIILMIRLATPIGIMIACAVKEGICLLEFADRKKLEKELEDIKRLFNAEILPGNCRYFDQLKRELAGYFGGTIKNFTVPFTVTGSAFQEKVWNGLMHIPYGETMSYRQQSIFLGIPRSVRAVGRANGDNRISILIPCHRVIGEKGALTGYGGGIWRKKFLIDLEKKSMKGRRMRKKEKEITDFEEIEAILGAAEICRLGLTDGMEAYIVPLNFGYRNRSLYFHTGREGKKIDLLRKNSRVCFEAEGEVEIRRADKACDWNTRYRSVMGHGSASLVTEHEEIREALNIIMSHYSPLREWEYREEVIDKNLCVIKVVIDEITGKKSGY